MWTVYPRNATFGLNVQPYYIGQGMGWTEYNQARVALYTLQQRGIECFLYLTEKESE